MATGRDDDDEFGTFLAYSPTTASLARSFGYVPPALRLPSPAPSLSPLQQTPPHLRNISTVGVGLASTPQQQQQQSRFAPYKRTPPTGPLLSSTPSPPSWAASPPSIGAAGVGLFSSSPTPTPPRQLGMSPRSPPSWAASPPSIGAAGVGMSPRSLPSWAALSPSVSSPPSASTPRRRQRPRPRARARPRPAVSGASGSTASSAHTRVSRTRNTPATRQRVRALQQTANNAVRGRRIAAVTETRTVTTTYKGNNHRPRVTRVSTRQSS